MEFTNEQLDFVKTCTAKGVKMAHQKVFAEALKATPNFSPDLTPGDLEGLSASGLDPFGMALVIDAYEASYPHYQACALALLALASEPRSFGFGCAPQQL